ncbi:ThuA domain-containing protein [Gorillibacterium massiliense]|uniref:ThuA domain-containing protein n=1 Tax=Gorillibacterium massiliense TaxID=1280390 RepID=UPI0005944C30|nr:ThuA domain-containing protein [Gorillibacterium massiliense]
MKQVLAVVGDYYHNGELAKDALNWALEPLIEEGEASVAYIGYEELPARLLERPDAVVMFKENRLNPQESEPLYWMTEETAASIASYVEKGGGWLVWHSGLASYHFGEDQTYVNMLRGHFISHPELNQSVRYIGNTPDTDGSSEPIDFSIQDEHYFVECDTENTDVFLRSESVDGESVAGWRHEFGAGRVICLTPAHKREGLLHPDVIGLLRSSVVWSFGS